jgi:hypothetical protein
MVMVNWNLMGGKLGRVLLALVVLFTQFHACSETYVNRSGSKCLDCVTILERHVELSAVTTPHGDCHDCCEIKDCEVPDDLAAATSSIPFGFVAILPPPSLVIPSSNQVEFVREPRSFLTQAPPTGPPSTLGSRAPPFFGLS